MPAYTSTDLASQMQRVAILASRDTSVVDRLRQLIAPWTYPQHWESTWQLIVDAEDAEQEHRELRTHSQEASLAPLERRKSLMAEWRRREVELIDLTHNLPESISLELPLVAALVPPDGAGLVSITVVNSAPELKKKPGSPRRRRRAAAIKLRPLTPKQLEAAQLHGEHKGNVTAVAKQVGVARQVMGRRIDAAMRKLGKKAVSTPQTTSLPRDRRGQETIQARSEEE